MKMIWIHVQNQFVAEGALMGNVKPRIYVLVKLDGQVQIAQPVLKNLVASMDSVMKLLNAGAKVDGLEVIVNYVSNF